MKKDQSYGNGAEWLVAKKLLSTKQIGQLLGVAPGTIRNWLTQGRFPSPTHVIGKQNRWDMRVVDAWVISKRVGA